MNDKDSGHGHGQPKVQLRVQTPRGIWTMTEPADADRRPEYPISAKTQEVIDDARHVFQFIENDSQYTLFRGHDKLEPQRTLASYGIESGTLLTLSVQGGNA
jgi:hypothetical protein